MGERRMKMSNMRDTSAALQQGLMLAQEQMSLLQRRVDALTGVLMVQTRMLADLTEVQDALSAMQEVPTDGRHAWPSKGLVHAWESCRVALVLPADRLGTMWERAAQWDVRRGGRFQTSGAAMLLWSSPRTANKQAARPHVQAFALVEHERPTAGQATVTHLGWKPDQNANAELMWRALETLAGEQLPLVENYS